MMKTQTRTSPESSQISMASYNEQTRALTVMFNSGSTYEYSDVPVEVWKAYQSAESVGKFLNQYIKGKFEYKKA